MTTTTNQLITVLEELQNISYEDLTEARKHNANANVALRLIFRIGQEGASFTEEEKKSVARNIAAAIKPLQINIERDGFEFRKNLDASVLRKRSALQFLVDTFGTFPIADNQTLSAVFQQVNLRETIGILDEIIQDHRDESDSDDVSRDRNVSGIPISHTWWF